MRSRLVARLVDTSTFPTGAREIGYDDPDDLEAFEELKGRAIRYASAKPSAQPIAWAKLAFGVAPIMALHLVHFSEPIAQGELAGEVELWVVVGDLPSMCFETDIAPTPRLALELYCAIAQDWVDNVIAGRDLSESYPIPVEPTREFAEMLLRRVEFIREEFVVRA